MGQKQNPFVSRKALISKFALLAWILVVWWDFMSDRILIVVFFCNFLYKFDWIVFFCNLD